VAAGFTPSASGKAYRCNPSALVSAIQGEL
jgi:hypothetical protein